MLYFLYLIFLLSRLGFASIYFGSAGISDYPNALDYEKSLGFKPVSYVEFQPITDILKDASVKYIDYLCSTRGSTSMIIITLEPFSGLNVVNASKLGLQFKKVRRDCTLMIRFAHEMNGNWYPWGGKEPELYKKVFTDVSRSIKKSRPNTLILWSPNLLWDKKSNPIKYYPDDPKTVDWIGLSFYNRDCRINRTIPALKVDDFDKWLKRKNKPVMIAEGAATWYTDGQKNCEGKQYDELDVKQRFWKEIWSEDFSAEYPFIKIWNWFQFKKLVGMPLKGMCDYRIISRDSQKIGKSFLKDSLTLIPNVGMELNPFLQRQSIYCQSSSDVLQQIILQS